MTNERERLTEKVDALLQEIGGGITVVSLTDAEKKSLELAMRATNLPVSDLQVEYVTALVSGFKTMWRYDAWEEGWKALSEWDCLCWKQCKCKPVNPYYAPKEG